MLFTLLSRTYAFRTFHLITSLENSNVLHPKFLSLIQRPILPLEIIDTETHSPSALIDTETHSPSGNRVVQEISAK